MISPLLFAMRGSNNDANTIRRRFYRYLASVFRGQRFLMQVLLKRPASKYGYAEGQLIACAGKSLPKAVNAFVFN
jgi:hypothetical protein